LQVFYRTLGVVASAWETGPLDKFSSERNRNLSNLTELLHARAAEQGSRIAFRYLPDGETEESRLSYDELESRARSIAASLAYQDAAGQRALLFYTGSLEFLAAFWG
jgi:acyl-CoA synthetase (AMP-forming)/AMP-acid ligase II